MDNWKFGIVNVDNVIVATPDFEDVIFHDKFNPETMKFAVEPEGKIVLTWGKLKSGR